VDVVVPRVLTCPRSVAMPGVEWEISSTALSGGVRNRNLVDKENVSSRGPTKATIRRVGSRPTSRGERLGRWKRPNDLSRRGAIGESLLRHRSFPSVLTEERDKALAFLRAEA
jgi:hypothetical protein